MRALPFFLHDSFTETDHTQARRIHTAAPHLHIHTQTPDTHIYIRSHTHLHTYTHAHAHTHTNTQMHAHRMHAHTTTEPGTDTLANSSTQTHGTLTPNMHHETITYSNASPL